MTSNQLDKAFHQIHSGGARRHPREWMDVNQIACDAILALGGTPADKMLRTLASLVTLRVCDKLRPMGIPDKPTDDSLKTVLEKTHPS